MWISINRIISQAEDAKYLGLHLDRRTEETIYSTSAKQLGIQLGKKHWLLGSKSQLSTKNMLLLYKTILKSGLSGLMAWGTASNSNIEILQRFQNRYLRIIINAS